MITSRGGTGKGRPEVQHGGSVGSFWPSGAKAGKNTGFSAEGMREGGQPNMAPIGDPAALPRLLKQGPPVPTALALGKDGVPANRNSGLCWEPAPL